jgi:hypothetical protein
MRSSTEIARRPAAERFEKPPSVDIPVLCPEGATAGYGRSEPHRGPADFEARRQHRLEMRASIHETLRVALTTRDGIAGETTRRCRRSRIDWRFVGRLEVGSPDRGMAQGTIGDRF